jgi:5'-methylthioadenosine phosphorylase
LLPDQIIDRTVHRNHTFFDQGVVAHVGIADPFCSLLQSSVDDAGTVAHRQLRHGGAYVCIEGPQFSTRAESNLYRNWGASVIGMTAMPEARLAREAELCYALLSMVTDYDVWHDSEEDVSIEVVNSHLQANSDSASAILRALAQAGLPERACACGSALDKALVSAPQSISAEARERIHLLIGDRLGSY